MLITRLTAINNFIGLRTVNSGVVVSCGDNHINNNISVNGTSTVLLTLQYATGRIVNLAIEARISATSGYWATPPAAFRFRRGRLWSCKGGVAPSQSPSN